ncbi:hypothetical protein RGQ29_020060 [Quercus rubra]|uniref:TTF-type domain-containing protein n=1 Tax=Quercus rubra TaxID=3512 RepID=A0AAN7FBK1_QUERU|nr:hypothetical protein RGQ29_020060 [Quercus rubra]
MPDEHPSKCPKLQFEEIDRDPGSRKQICEFPIDKQDEIRRAYIEKGSYQPKNSYYPYNDDTHRCRFQPSWFNSHKDWLEYSPSMDVIYCLPCYLFSKKPIGRPGSDAFISTGFNNWKKVKDGMNCPLVRHVGKEPNSPHKIALIEKQTPKELENNRLRLKTLVECARWLAFQACAFRGHDESLDSINRGNFIELIKFTSTFNDKVTSVVLENAPGNAKYTSPTIQKKILHILASNVRNAIREEIGDAKFCILVDEARDESKREQMAIILRFVDKEGFIKERFFFHIVHVRDTTTLTLKNEICVVLSYYNLHIENIRGQGYDGASNMRGEWNGLQGLFLKDCPYAYYVHCMAHRLQLALVTASREVKDVHQFFDHLVNIINIVVVSSKRNDELQHAQAEQEWANYKQRGDAERAYQVLTSFEFILILHLMKEIMGITNVRCQALQQHSQDLLNAMHLVSTTKSLIQELRDDGWEPLLASVISFCEQHEIDIPDMNARYTKGRGRYCRQDDDLTMEHHFRIGIFTVAINFQLQELKSRFSELTIELVILTFLAMKLLKTRFRNRMDDEFLADNMIVYIEKEIAGNFTIEMLMDEFYSMKNRHQA